jgi:hypothetical protein
MTAKDMEEKFPGEWILVGEPQTSDKLEVVEGTVLHHSKDRDEVYRRAIALPPPKRYAVLFTGRMPANTAIVL